MKITKAILLRLIREGEYQKKSDEFEDAAEDIGSTLDTAATRIGNALGDPKMGKEIAGGVAHDMFGTQKKSNYVYEEKGDDPMGSDVVMYHSERSGEDPFELRGIKWQFVNGIYPNGKKDIAVYRFGHDIAYGYKWWRKTFLGDDTLEERASSKAQQRLMGMVRACQKNGDCASEKVRKMAKDMKYSDVKDYAETKHDSLPGKVDESGFEELNAYGRADELDPSEWEARQSMAQGNEMRETILSALRSNPEFAELSDEELIDIAGAYLRADDEQSHMYENKMVKNGLVESAMKLKTASKKVVKRIKIKDL